MKRYIGCMVVGLVLLTAVALPAPAEPLDQRVVAFAHRYLEDEVTLSRGDPLEFTNLDVAPHDMVSLDSGPDGLPLFSTATVSIGTTVLVEGLEEIPVGVYDFTCTLHPQMIGTIYLEEASG